MNRKKDKLLSERDRLLVRPRKPLPTSEDPREPKTAIIDPKIVDQKTQSTVARSSRIDYVA